MSKSLLVLGLSIALAVPVGIAAPIAEHSASVGSKGPGWVAFRFEVTAPAALALSIVRDPPYEGPTFEALGVFVHRLDGAYDSAVTSQSGASGNTILLESGLGSGRLIYETNATNSHFCGYCTVGTGLSWAGGPYESLPAGTYVGVAMVAGIGANDVVWVNLTGDDSVIVQTPATAGSTVTLARDDDFHGPLNAIIYHDVETPIGDRGPKLKAQVDAAYALPIDQSFFGVYYAAGDESAHLSWSGPDRASHPVAAFGFAMFEAAPRGEYSFHVTDHRVGLNTPQVVVFGADVPILSGATP